jgi:hypothetical protein
MFLNIVTQGVTILVSVVVSGLISYFISFLLSKANDKLIFVLPIVSFVGAIVFWMLGLTSNDWSALGYLLYAGFATIFFVGSIIASLLLWKKNKNKK